MSDALYYTSHESVIGKLLIVASARGIRYLTVISGSDSAEDCLARTFPATSLTELDGFFATTKAAIDRYLNQGEALKLPVDLTGGTPLQRMVWLEIAKIPYGETISYTTLAERVGFPRAVRAVASACGANPVPLVVPCHRVLAKDGSMGGFSVPGGIEVKEMLLRKEARTQRTAA